MAKVKRSVLKEIVKECLLEILFEGIDSEPGYDEEPIREARQPQRRAPRPSSNRNLAAAVHQSSLNKHVSSQKTNPAENFVQSAVNELTEDPMMASIFADTAQTTLQEQKEGRRPPVDNAAAVVDHTEDMSDIFTGAGNWAAIAFGETE